MHNIFACVIVSSVFHINVGIYTLNDNGDYIGVYSTAGHSWQAALDFCEQNISTSLASIHSEEDRIRAMNSVNYFHNASGTSLTVFNYAWIGLYSPQSQNDEPFEWTDGTTYDYDYFHLGEPSGDGNCTEITGPEGVWSGEWNDRKCSTGFILWICNKPPTATPTNMPTSPTVVPSYNPSTIPSSVPTDHPSIEPTEMPTMFPTFTVHDGYNYSLVIDFLLEMNLTNVAQVVQDSILLQKTLIFALKSASQVVRYDIGHVDEVDVFIMNISAGNSSGDNQDILVSCELVFDEERSMELWIVDIENVITEFELSLMDYWDTDDISIEWDNLRVISEQISTTTDRITTREEIASTTSQASTREPGSGSSSNDDEPTIIGNMTLDDLSYATLGVLLIVAVIVTISGIIDAWYCRHNELFDMSTMVVVTMYLMDVLSGTCIYNVRLLRWCNFVLNRIQNNENESKKKYMYLILNRKRFSYLFNWTKTSGRNTVDNSSRLDRSTKQNGIVFCDFVHKY